MAYRERNKGQIGNNAAIIGSDLKLLVRLSLYRILEPPHVTP